MNKIAHLAAKATIAVHKYSCGRFGGNLMNNAVGVVGVL